MKKKCSLKNVHLSVIILSEICDNKCFRKDSIFSISIVLYTLAHCTSGNLLEIQKSNLSIRLMKI